MSNLFNFMQYKIEDEGLDYCFMHYSNWKEVKDEKFHELRLAFIKAAEELTEYVANNVSEEDEDDEE